MSEEKQQKRNVPELRFPEFSEEWEEKEIRNEFNFFNNKRKPIKENQREKGEFPYYGATGIIDYVNNYIFDGNYILIGEDGANIISRSAPLVYYTRGKFWVNNHAHILEPKKGNKYYYYTLLEKINYGKYNTGTAQPKLNIQNLKKIKIIATENLDEQQKIGEFFNRLDRQIDLEEKKLALLEEQKKGYMQKIFSQELRFKDENGNEYPEWEEKKLGEIAEITMGQSPKSKNYTNDSNYMVLVQGNADLNNGKVYPRIFTKEKTKVTDTNDILLTVRAPVGEIGLSQFPVVIGRGVCSIKASKFIFFCLEYLKEVNWWSRISQGSTFEAISGKEIRELSIQLPKDANEQFKIISILNVVNNKVRKSKEKIVLIKERKSALLRKVFI